MKWTELSDFRSNAHLQFGMSIAYWIPQSSPPRALVSQVKLTSTDRNVRRLTLDSPILASSNANRSGQIRILRSEYPLHNLGFPNPRLLESSGHHPHDRAHTLSLMASVAQENSGISPTSARLKLYSYWHSSCAWRVRIALNLKGLPYDYKAVNIGKGEHLSEEYTKLNPLRLVPTLVDGDIVVSDSLAILLYLEDKFPGHPLLPDDLHLKAVSLQLWRSCWRMLQESIL